MEEGYRARANSIHVRMDDKEYGKFLKKVEESGLSKRKYVCDAVLGVKIYRCDFGHEIVSELSRVGNNLNQVVKNFYTGDSTAKEILDAKNECMAVIEEIRKIFYRSDSNADT